MPAKAGVDNDKGTDEETVKMTERLQEAAKVAKGNANAKAPNKPDSPIDIIGKGNAANGAGVAKQGRRKGDGAQGVVKEETKEDVEVETELNSILKKSPSTFSLSSRPFSRVFYDFWKWLTRSSNYLLEIILPAFEARKGYLAQQIQHHACALRGRTGPPPLGSEPAV